MRRFGAVLALVVVVSSCSTPDETAPTVETTVPPPTAVTTTIARLAPSTSPAAVTTTSTTQPPPVPSLPTTTTSLVDPPEGWGSLAIDPAVFAEVTLVDGAMLDGRSVLTGCARQWDAPVGFPVWWSDDLATWHRAEAPAVTSCVMQIEASDFGLYARGSGAIGLLHSTDGSEWATVPIHEVFGYEEAWALGSVFGVFVAPDGGRVTALFSAASEGESRIATLMTTTDGDTWTEGPVESASLFDSSDVSSVIAAGPGLVAVGASPGGEFVPTGAVFTSVDGLHWTRATPFAEDFDDAVMNDVLEVGDRYVAVGGDFFRSGEMVAWTSDDATGWARSPSPGEDVDPSVAHLTAESLTVSGGWIWASGVDFDARRGIARRPALWRSADGIAWERIGLTSLETAVPFVVLETPDLRLGVWPPPRSLLEVPCQLFAAD